MCHLTAIQNKDYDKEMKIIPLFKQNISGRLSSIIFGDTVIVRINKRFQFQFTLSISLLFGRQIIMYTRIYNFLLHFRFTLKRKI